MDLSPSELSHPLASIWDSPLLTSSGYEEEDKGGKQMIVEAEATTHELQVLQEDASAQKMEQARWRHHLPFSVLGKEVLMLDMMLSFQATIKQQTSSTTTDKN